MNTDEFISLLARQSGSEPPVAASRRMAGALACGLLAAALLMYVTLGMRTDAALAVTQPMWWWKLVYALGIGCAALIVTLRLAQPGLRPGRAWAGLLVPVAAVAVAMLVVLWRAEPGTRAALVQGDTWKVCPLLIGMLSIPALASVFWGIRALAPTRLRLTGACAGLLAGSLATAVYCLHCPEMQVPFWGTWYTAGMLVPAVAGALLGPRLLRW
jgi:hypothetical protein